MKTNENQNEKTSYSRFQVFQGEKSTDGAVRKLKSVGMAYLREAQAIFTLRLWMFSWERYYLVPSKVDSAKYLVMTREPNRSPNAKNKYFWNIVGNASVDSSHGVMEMNFDLLERPIYMNLYPEASASSTLVPEPDALDPAA